MDANGEHADVDLQVVQMARHTRAVPATAVTHSVQGKSAPGAKGKPSEVRKKVAKQSKRLPQSGSIFRPGMYVFIPGGTAKLIQKVDVTHWSVKVLSGTGLSSVRSGRSGTLVSQKTLQPVLVINPRAPGKCQDL